MRRVVIGVFFALTAVACGVEAQVLSGPGTTTLDPDSPLALVDIDAGLAGVPVGSSEPRWVVPGAVAAPDGSAVFAARAVSNAAGNGFEVVRIDPHTGTESRVGLHVPGPSAAVHVAAVAPGGDRLALAAPGDDKTLVLDFDPSSGGGDYKPTFEGTVEPEAFSLDGTRLFAARIYDDRYHVHVLELPTAKQWPTLGPDKTWPPEDMYGSVVQAVLSPDRTQLATLYRDSSTPDHTAFVHLLSLATGATVCIDLHAPFGTGGPGTDALVWKPDGKVTVGHSAVDPAESMQASFEPAAIWAGEPQAHYHAETQPNPSAPAIPDGVAATPGFERFVALAI